CLRRQWRTYGSLSEDCWIIGGRCRGWETQKEGRQKTPPPKGQPRPFLLFYFTPPSLLLTKRITLPLYYSRKISTAGANFLLREFPEATNNSCPHAAHEGFGNESPSDALNSLWSRLS